MNNIEQNQRTNNAPVEQKAPEQGMRINGLQQVVELLQHADPAFRESLLKRLTQRDPQLAQQLRRIVR